MTRVKYTERQRLRAQDLRGEQDYLLGLAGRHYIGPHGWGIVRGLSVIVENNKAIITPGLAIDGYGRELLVHENIEQPLPQDVPGQFVYLFYCERPQGACGAGPNARWRDSAEVIIRESSWPLPESQSNLDLARAAGRISDGQPWPVLLGFINVDKTVVGSEVRVTRVSAARVASTTKRAIMRIGQENLADRYHFRISAQDGKDTLRDRFAINLDGNTSIWGNLALEGSAFQKIIKLAKDRFLKIEGTSAAAADLLFRVRSGIEGGQRVLTVVFRKKGELATAFEQKFRIDNQRSIQSRVRNFNKTDRPIRFANERVEAPTENNQEEPKSQEAFDDLVDQESSLERAGAVLKFDVETVQPATRFCGCGEENDNEAELPAGLIFKPVAKAPTALTSRDIYSIAVKDADQTSIEEMRMSGGAFADGDFTRRVTFAGSTATSPLQPWLLVRGNGNLELPGGRRKADGTAFDMIRATGTAIYPPVKPDPRDPLFNYLLVLAFIRGVMIFSSSLLEVTFPRTPEVIELGKPWEYDIKLHNLSQLSTLKMKTSIELLKTNAGSIPSPDFLKTEQLTINQTVTETIKHLKLPGTIKPKTLVIDVSIQMDADGDPVAAGGTSKEIPVYEPPSVEFSARPDSVEAGATFKVVLKIKNGDSEQVSIRAIQLDVAGSTTSVDITEPSELGPGESSSIDEISLTAPTAGEEFDVTATVSFRWATPAVDSSISARTTVDIDAPAPIT